MSPTESFDELEQKIAQRIEEALTEVREEFLERLQGARERLDEVVTSELVSAKQEAEASATAAVEARAEAEESRAALFAEAEESKVAAIAEALEAKEAEFAELLGVREAALADAEQARDTALAEAEEARSALAAEADEAKTTLLAEAEEAKATLLAEAEETKAAAVEAATEAKESEFSEALAAKESAFTELEEAKAAALAAAEEERESAVEMAAQEAAVGAMLQLHERVTKIDSAQSQTEVLAALLEGSAGYASRSLLFLTREDGLQGWGGQGFDTEEGHLQETHLDYSEQSALAELSEGRGTVKMSGDSCSDLCKAVDGSSPQDGIMIPLVLRDRLAAALYADRLGEGDPFQLVTLQLLAYVAGQALEALPMRQRSATATLRLATEAAANEPGLELWQFLAPDEPEEEFAAEPVEEPVPVPAEPEELAAEEDFQEPPTPVEVKPEPEFKPEPEIAEAAGFEMEEAAVATEEEEMVAEEPVIEAEAIEVEEDVAEEPVSAVEPAIEVTPPTEVAPPTKVAPPTEVVPPAAGAEVAPPEDVDGPGWAFTTRRFSSESSEDAGHEEARRLARLLVTEIKLYNEEQVEEGRRGRNVYRTLKEDIDRSRQIYDERIEESVRTGTDYFRDELVKILAAGDEEVMGM